MGKKIAIIGGGVSGLACAQRLAAESESSIDSIVVFDTGNRTCGGRISSRMDKQSGYEFDHAAQYFSVKDNKTEFAEYCREATKRGELYAIDDLSRYGILMREEDKQQHYVFRRFEDELVRYASKDGFRAFIKHLEESVLDVASDRKNRIERPQWVGSMQKTNSNTWLLANTQDRSRKNYRELGEYDFVVIAHNGKCAFNLMKTAVNNNAEKKNESPKILSALKASFGIKTREALYKKRELVLSSIWSANVAIGNLDEDTMQKLDAFDGAHVIENESLAYIGNNTLKKKKKDEMNSIREITLLSTPVYGKRNKCPQEAIPAAFADKVQLDLVTELEKTLGIAPNVLSNNVVFSKMQLWGAANGLTVANNEYLFDANASVGVCGDWLTTDDQSPSVETAMRSGWRLAEALLHESTENHLQVNWKPVQNASALGLTVPGADLPDPPPEEADDAKNAAGKKNVEKYSAKEKARSQATGDGDDDDVRASEHPRLIVFFNFFSSFIFQAVREKKHKNTQHVETRPSRHDFCDDFLFFFEQTTTTTAFFPQSCSLLLLDFDDDDDELEILVRENVFVPTRCSRRQTTRAIEKKKKKNTKNHDAELFAFLPISQRLVETFREDR